MLTAHSDQGPLFTSGSPKSLLFPHSCTVHGSFQEQRERLTHTHAHMHVHTHAHTYTHGILATVLPSLSGNRKGCRLLVQNTQNTGTAATFCQKRASLGRRVSEAVRVGTVRACSGTAPGTTTRARLLFASSGTCLTASRGKVVFKKTERKEKRHNHRQMKEDTSTEVRPPPPRA